MPDLITIDDFVSRIGREQVTQLAGVGSFNSAEGRSLDEAKICKAISFASSFLSGFVAKRYPKATSQGANWTPEILKGYASDIAHYRLRLESGDRNAVTDEVQKRYDDARSWAKDVSRGLVNIEGAGEDQNGDTSPTGTVMSSVPSGRAADILRGFS